MSRFADKKIDFFIAGAQKAGTTALHAKLSGHPGLGCSSKKELHIFDDDEGRNWDAPDFSDVGKYFKAASVDCLWGEATPIYMYWPQAMERLARYNPQAKIIISLRHPAWRALSHWKMETSRGLENLKFDQAVSETGRARGAPFHRVYSYVERGFYAPQIARILEMFPRKNVMFCTTEQLHLDEVALLRRICDFLGVTGDLELAGPKVIRPYDTSHIETADSATHAAMARLLDLYRDDILETEKRTQLALAHWCDESYPSSLSGPVHASPNMTFDDACQ